MAETSTALILGASRGLGLALAQTFAARGWHVAGTVRGDARTALHEAAETADGRIAVEHLEMTDQASLEVLATRLAAQGRVLDVLFVNAGVALGADDRLATVATEDFVRLMTVNVLAPLRAIERLAPLVAPDGIIAAMSSILGSVGSNESGGWETYRASKAALNTAMRSYAARHKDGRSLALVHPGWVRTDMGGASASLDVSDSIPGVVDALLARRGQPGLQFFDYTGKTVAW